MVTLAKGPHLAQAKFIESLRVAAQPLKTDRHVIAGRATGRPNSGHMTFQVQ
jgi:hypothetical protein